MTNSKSTETLLKVVQSRISELKLELSRINEIVGGRKETVDKLINEIKSLNTNVDELKSLRNEHILRGDFAQIESINYSFKKIKDEILKLSLNLEDRKKDLIIGNARLDAVIESLKEKLGEAKKVEKIIQEKKIARENSNLNLENLLTDEIISQRSHKSNKK